MKCETEFIEVECKSCYGDGVDDSQGARVGCMMCGATGKQSVLRSVYDKKDNNYVARNVSSISIRVGRI